jgi:hypothetical protein
VVLVVVDKVKISLGDLFGEPVSEQAPVIVQVVWKKSCNNCSNLPEVLIRSKKTKIEYQMCAPDWDSAIWKSEYIEITRRKL